MTVALSPELDYIISTCFRDDATLPDECLNWSEFSRVVIGNRIVNYTLNRAGSKITDQDTLDRLRQIKRNGTLSSLHSLAEIAKIGDVARKHQIPVYFYKGQVWSQWLFGDFEMRSPGDIDLFVPEHYLLAFVDILKDTLGYTVQPYHHFLLESPNSIRKNFLDSDYHIPLHKSDPSGKTLAIVEVHWQIAYPRLCFNFSPDDFEAFATTLTVAGNNLPVLTNEYQLLMLLVNHAGKEDWKQLRYVVDLKAYMDRYGESTNWDLVADLARKKGISRLLETSLSLLKTLGYHWRAEYPNVAYLNEIQRYFDMWRNLPPEPKNMSWRYFRHALKTRDRKYRPAIVKAHVRFLADLKLHLHKLKWYNQRD